MCGFTVIILHVCEKFSGNIFLFVLWINCYVQCINVLLCIVTY